MKRHRSAHISGVIEGIVLGSCMDRLLLGASWYAWVVTIALVAITVGSILDWGIE